MSHFASAPPFGLYERLLARRYLRARREHGGVALISIISFVGIMLAVAVLTITMSVMNGFRDTLLNAILGVDGHVYIWTDGRTPDEIADIERLVRQSAEVTHVARIVEGQVLATADGRATGALVRGLAREELAAQEIIADNMRAGSLEAYRVDEDGAAGVVIGAALARQLGADFAFTANPAVTLISPQGPATPFGIAPRRKTYAIAGVFMSGMSKADQLYVYMPLEEAQRFFGRGEAVDRLEVRIQDPDLAREAAIAIAARLPPGIVVEDWRFYNDSFVGALDIERTVMRLILMMIVAIAAMNIISGLVMLVKNKSRDIAILRTMGATQGAILRIFFMAGASVGVLGALAGLAIGVVFCLNIGPIQDFVSFIIQRPIFPGDVYLLSRLPAKVDWLEVTGITLFALAMSFLATLPPAWRASRLDPVEALRYE